MTIGEQISTQRKRKGITQEMLSEISGISLRTIQRIENNESQPRAFTLKTLADKLDMDIEKIEELQSLSVTVTSKPFFNSLVRRINLAGLSVIIIPALPVIIMIAIWMRNRNDEGLSVIGKRIISFQLIWLVLTFFVVASTKIFYYYITGMHANGNLSPVVPAYLIMVTFNLFAVIYSARKLDHQEIGIFYRLTPNFL